MTLRRFSFAFLALACAVQSAQAQAVERILVDGKKVQGIRFDGPPWERARGWLEGGGAGSALYAADNVGAGDFALQVRIALTERSASGACIVLGDSAFGFDGRDKQLSLEGALFATKPALEDAAKVWQPGQLFDFEARRAGSTLTITIDQKTVCTFACDARPIGRVGVVPGKQTVQLARFVVRGELSQPLPNAKDEKLAAVVDQAVARGVEWLQACQLRDGSWRHLQYGFVAGQTALTAYTLMRAGLPPDHPSVARALFYLDQVMPNETYTAGLMMMAYEATTDPQRLPRMRAILAKLLEWNDKGLWSYPWQNENDFAKWLNTRAASDLSNTQYAVLGLRAAHHAGLEVPDKVWNEALERVVALQESAHDVDSYVETVKTGSPREAIAGFRYAQGREVSASMTAAGLSVLQMCRDALGSKLRGKGALDSQRAIQLGVAWLGHNFTVENNPGGDRLWQFYFIYGLERVGGLLGLELFGQHEWYRECAEWLIKKQNGDGHWSTANVFGFNSYHANQDEADTCFAILCLKRASRPVVRTGDAFARRTVPPPPDPDEAVHLRTSGTTAVTLWIDGFNDDALARNGGGELGGLRIAFVEYVDGGAVLERLDGDPGHAWEGASFSVHHTFTHPGVHRMVARVHLVAPDAAVDSKDATIAIESKPVDVKSDGTLESWMSEAASARGRNLLLAQAVTIAPSSEHSGGEGGLKVLDGLQATRWLCAETDKAPMIVLDISKPLKADTLVISPACGSRDELGRFDRVTEVSVRLNRDKESIKIALDADELKPTVFKLDKLTSLTHLEIRITQRRPGTTARNQAGFAEIALERHDR